VAYCTRAIFPQHGYGGLERSSTGLMQHLLARGVDVALFTRPLPPGRPVAPEAEAAGRLTVHATRYGTLPLPPNGIAARLTNYRAFVEDAGMRVEGLARRGFVHAVYAHGMFARGVRRAAEWGVPMVANPHGLEEFNVTDPLKRLAYAPFRAWVRAGCRAADRVIATDAVMKEDVARKLGIDARRVAVIPNAVDVEHIAELVSADALASLDERFPLTAGVPVRGIGVGRLEANKGFDVLLRALANNISEMPPGWRWLIVGEGSQRESLEALAATLGLGQHIHFTGALSDQELHSLLAACDLFAHATLYEGSSLVTLEAMAHGLPVVASAVGGIPDKVEPGGSGFLVAPGDVAGLGMRIAWLAQRPEERARMGRRSAEIVRERFSLSRSAAMTRDLLEALVAQTRACRGEAQPAHA
jgi:glycosyltransferase involved in cell wall biosynthesis